MSHSTMVEVSVVDTVFTFSFGTRKPAEMLNLKVNESLSFTGKEAEAALADVMGAHFAGYFEANMVTHMLEQSGKTTREYVNQNFRNIVEQDEKLRTSVQSLRYFTQVLIHTFDADLKDEIDLPKTLCTKAGILSIIDYIAGKGKLGRKTQAILGNIVHGFTGQTVEFPEDDNEITANIWDWMNRDHAGYIKAYQKTAEEELDHVFRVTFYHHD